MEPNRRMEYAFQKRYRGCGHTINTFGWYNEEADVQFRSSFQKGQPLVYFQYKCEDCRARQNIGDSNIKFLLTGLRTQIDGYVKKMQELSNETKELKISINKKDVEIQKAREQSVKYHESWMRVLARQEKQDGELRTLHQEKKDYEAEVQNKNIFSILPPHN
jgi:hypothetical protein